MAPPEMLYQRLRRRQADERARHVRVPDLAVPGRAARNVPAAGRVDGEDRLVGGFEARDDGGKGVAEGPGEGEAEDGVDDELGLGEERAEVGVLGRCYFYLLA